MGIFGGKSWRGLGGEEEMTDQDWQRRGLEQGVAMLSGQPWQNSSPDEDNVSTGGCYNGDYSQAHHDECNCRLAEDEHYEAVVEQQLRELHHYQ